MVRSPAIRKARDVHHRYDAAKQMLYRGEGVTLGAKNMNAVITTVAGDGAWGYSGDGDPATQASLSSPDGVAVDAQGNLYILDEQRIRKVGTDGIITTMAGNGVFGYSGEGGPATQARLAVPVGVHQKFSGCPRFFGRLG